MNIMVASDLHLEVRMGSVVDVIPESALYKHPDVLVLAGDIDTHDYLEESLAEIMDVFAGIPVIYVPGNHEYYGGEFHRTHQKIHDIANRLKKKRPFHLLDNSSVSIEGIHFYGGCMWSDASIVSSGDEYMIRNGQRQFDHALMNSLHNDFVSGLDCHIETFGEKNTVVISHFCPSSNIIHPSHGVNEITPYFNVDMSRYTTQNLRAWVWGHTHHRHYDVTPSGCQMISAQEGYPSEQGVVTGTPTPFSIFTI